MSRKLVILACLAISVSFYITSQLSVSIQYLHNEKVPAKQDAPKNTVLNEEDILMSFRHGNTGSLSDPIAVSHTRIASISTTYLHPILIYRQGLTSLIPSKIPVVLWPYMDAAQKLGKRSSADVLHIEVNGVEESSILQLADSGVRTLEENVVWVTDAKFQYSVWCTRLAEKALKVAEMRTNQGMTPIWPIFVVDFTDPPGAPRRCSQLEDVVGVSHVLYFKRSIVARNWNFTKNWLDFQEPNQTPDFEHTPLIVRTDIVEGMANNLTNLSRLVYRNRPVDVAHYWPPSTLPLNLGNLRNRVSASLVDHLGKDYQVFCDVVGKHDRVGRRNAQTAYIESMRDTKIIVVAQRDTYEDHYRLYEALASGALVMTDPMFTSPFQNGTHLLVYDSLSHLIDLVKYYLSHDDERLKVASSGYYFAMDRHRSHHRMEEIVLGKPITTCERPGAISQCPFTVHSNEWLIGAS